MISKLKRLKLSMRVEFVRLTQPAYQNSRVGLKNPNPKKIEPLRTGPNSPWVGLRANMPNPPTRHGLGWVNIFQPAGVGLARDMARQLPSFWRADPTRLNRTQLTTLKETPLTAQLKNRIIQFPFRIIKILFHSIVINKNI